MITSYQKSNRALFIKSVENRTTPLGVGLKNQCFVGLAIEAAKNEGNKLVEHYGGTSEEWKILVKLNNSTPAPLRNNTMLEVFT